MDRTQSAPVSRPRSTTIPENNDLQRSASDFGVWLATSNESTGDYALYSGSMQPQASLQAIPETTVEYTPSDYINTCIEATSPSVPFDNMHVQLTPQWCQSSDYSTSPSTPQTAMMTPVTQSSNTMSRRSSLNTPFIDETSLRVPFDSQYLAILPEDSQLSFSASSCINGSKFDPNFLSSFTGPVASDPVLFPAFTSVPVSNASVYALAPSGHQQNESYLAEDMRRSTSHQSSESSASSTRSSISRRSRREREINAAAASRPLAPKAGDAAAASSRDQMARVVSSDGSSKNVGVISKAPYVRPQHPKIMCAQCNLRPNGFRGAHELDRHVLRAHAAVRRGYVCVAPAFQKHFLDNCKHCRNGKVYGAYYNAAAHLRRAHFHPRKRGRKGKNDEKRGGIGGGDHPAMEWLREHWIRDLEVPNTVDSESDSAGETPGAGAGASISVGAAGASNALSPPLALDAPPHPAASLAPPQMPLDYGLSDSIQPADPVAYETYAYASVDGFEFDAYRTRS
ncbi:uncharacterized protein M421DRAFT_417188 [Didymella exigua CBS 183.55]|uniref:DUF7896 domain-containing protein n=1 Tax=Didymella exigua CBS 183.55 TaxID=1150837 RepID=A0A6A5RXZ2_9PLEO|nr:uncharacterized protein M421DRAFT_417188 [Didymella exigua CBS 183.55]KAF1932473.1 hypothetical protein M421DRAFT_417188 [Didymella exigua CBS 183.55]